MRASRATVLILLLTGGGCSFVVDVPSPAPLAAGKTSFSSIHACLGNFEEGPNKNIVLRQIHEYALNPSPGAYVANVLASELARNGAYVEREGCDQSSRTAKIFGRITQAEVQFTPGTWTVTVTSSVKADVDIQGCDGIFQKTSFSYSGETAPFRVMIAKRGASVEELLPLSVRDLVKSVVQDPAFIRGLREASETCAETRENSPPEATEPGT